MNSKHVLVIDDEDAVRRIICDNLKFAGFSVTGMPDGQQGLEAVNANPPAIVITDIIMPGISGLDVISELRRTHPHIRLIAMSGGGKVKETDDLLEKAGQLGADVVLSKPLDIDELEKIIGTFLEE